MERLRRDVERFRRLPWRFQDVLRLFACRGGAPDRKDLLFGRGDRLAVIDDGQRVGDPHPEQALGLLDHIHRVRLGEAARRDGLELGDPAPDEVPVRVLIEGLFGRRVDADCVDPGHAALHLQLVVVNAGLVIEELLSEVLARELPGQPQVIRGEGHHHARIRKLSQPVALR